MKYLLLLLLSLPSQASETRQIIALIDSGLNHSAYINPYLCETGHRDFTQTSLVDRLGHGTEVAKIISKYINPKKSCLLIVKWIDKKYDSESYSYYNALKYTANYKEAAIINMSLEGTGSIDDEKEVILNAVNKDKTFVIAAGNNNLDLNINCDVYPACHFYSTKNIFVVGCGQNGKSNYNGPVNSVVKNTTYTSWATAHKTGKLARKMEKQ